MLQMTFVESLKRVRRSLGYETHAFGCFLALELAANTVHVVYLSSTVGKSSIKEP